MQSHNAAPIELIDVDPYKFQPHFLSWIESTNKGKGYRLLKNLAIPLGIQPKRMAGGSCWTLSQSGILYLWQNYQWNGANVVPDNPQRLLASAIHDALCTARGSEVVGYWQRHAIYRRVMLAQGANKAEAWGDWLGLVCWNWTRD